MTCQPLTELSLFSGAGGGILGSLLLGHTIIGAVEHNEYCCRVLEARQRDGFLSPFPIFQTDIRDFVRSGYASLYKGRCDIVSAGFPCQPFSVAGRQAGADDERNMWPATRNVIRFVHPKSVLLENVPGLVSCGYLGTVLSDLAAMGYVGRWGVLSACAEGAPHTRERLFIVAHRDREGLQERQVFARVASRQDAGQEREAAAVCSWWASEPGFCRLDDGTPNRVGRIRAAGNSQVPSVVARAWQELTA